MVPLNHIMWCSKIWPNFFPRMTRSSTVLPMQPSPHSFHVLLAVVITSYTMNSSILRLWKDVCWAGLILQYSSIMTWTVYKRHCRRWWRKRTWQSPIVALLWHKDCSKTLVTFAHSRRYLICVRRTSFALFSMTAMDLVRWERRAEVHRSTSASLHGKWMYTLEAWVEHLVRSVGSALGKVILLTSNVSVHLRMYSRHHYHHTSPPVHLKQLICLTKITAILSVYMKTQSECVSSFVKHTLILLKLLLSSQTVMPHLL